MFVRAADLLTQKLEENDIISSEQYEICRFGFRLGLTIILNLITVIVIGASMSELGPALLFMALYIPLRSNAGGYHAQTAIRCYVFSIFLMIAFLLAMKHLFISRFICVIINILSFIVIFAFAPVEDKNKPLDQMEQCVYRKRTRIVLIVESIIMIVGVILDTKTIYLCSTWNIIIMSAILLIGKWKNHLMR